MVINKSRALYRKYHAMLQLLQMKSITLNNRKGKVMN